MKSPVVVIGIGEMGSVFARGFLRAGYPVYPVTRQSDLAETAQRLPSPGLVLVAVAAWFQRIGLLQTELLPNDWQQYGFPQPTVISVWFEKKPGQDVKVLIPSPVFGPAAEMISACLESIQIPARVLPDAQALLFELVVKNVYIVTTNCAGLVTGGTVDELRSGHQDLMEGIAREVIRIQESLTGQSFVPEDLIDAMLMAFDGDPEHRCMGRSAPARLARALQQADSAGLEIPKLREIAAVTG